MIRKENIDRRLARIESRIVQIMLKLEIDPYGNMYDKFNNDQHGGTSNADSQSPIPITRKTQRRGPSVID
jgi:hypothetical protein